MEKKPKGFQKGHKINIGKKHSKETLLKMSISARGRKVSNKTKEKLRKNRIGKKHSLETRKKMSESRKGKLNSFYGKKHTMETLLKMSSYRGSDKGNWKGGITPLRKKLRETFEYRKWSRAVKKRDGYRCIWCGSVENLEADHIKQFSYYTELRFELTNGRTLCRDCHMKTETYGVAKKD